VPRASVWILALAACGRAHFDDAGPLPFTHLDSQFDYGSATAISVTFANVSAGDTLVFALNLYQPPTGTLLTATDSSGDAVQMLGPLDRIDERHYVGYVENATAGMHTLAYTTDTQSHLELYAQQYGGIAASSSLDAFAWANGTTVGPDTMQSGFATTTWPVELLFGYGETNASGSVGEGFTLRASDHNNVVEDQVVRQPGSYQAVATNISGTGWTMVMMTFRAAN
jgi:hypothetical protein